MNLNWPTKFTLPILFLAGIYGCSHSTRVPRLPVGFWRLNGDTLAREAISRGDSGLIVLFFPDSTSVAFVREINLDMDQEHDFYHLHYGDLGIDAAMLTNSRDSIARFLDAYNVRILATLAGIDPQEFLRQLQCPREKMLRHAC